VAQLYEVLPPLSDQEYQALKDDIKQRGAVMVPVEYDEASNILDGHHRVRACQELGIKSWSSITRIGMSEEEKRNYARMLNLTRRHLSKEQLREQWEAMRADGMTYQAIADATGVSEVTVLRAVPSNEGTQPEFIIGKDGKKYPAKKRKGKKSVVAKDTAERNRTQAALVGMDTEQLPDKLLDAKRVTRLAREQASEARGQEITGDIEAGEIRLWLGDFRERGHEIEDSSVDLIFTDPPYPQEYLPLWGDLASFANRALKPSGMLVAYTGAMYLPEVMGYLGRHLRYWWMGAIVLPGAHSRVHARNVAQGCKPLLFYVREDFNSEIWFEDTFQSEEIQKQSHPWQQSLGAALYYIAKLIPGEGLVVDPFLGGGTTGVAAALLKKAFVGIEMEKVAFAEAQNRIGEAHGK